MRCMCRPLNCKQIQNQSNRTRDKDLETFVVGIMTSLPPLPLFIAPYLGYYFINFNSAFYQIYPQIIFYV
jgi:hypothetical protein